MEQELFFSGYCRVQDQSRMVAFVVEDGCLEEADCCYPDCIYASECPIAKEIGQHISL